MRGPALLLLLAALPALVASCGESDDATALDLVVDPRATVDQIDIRGVTLAGGPVTLPEHLLPTQPTRLNAGDVLRLLFADDKGGSNVVVTAIGLYQGAPVTANEIAMGTLQTKHPVRATLVLGSGATGGNGGAGGGGGGGGTSGSAGSGGSTAGGGATGTGGGAGRGGTSGTAGAGGTAGASGSGGVAGTAGRGGTGGGGTGGGGRGGGTAGTGGAAGRGGTGGTGGTGTAGRGGAGGTGTAGRGGSNGGTGGTGGAPLCMVVPVLTPAIATEIPLSVLGNITECGYPIMGAGIIMYAAVNGSRFALIRDLEFAQSAACGRCIEVTATDVARATVVTVVGSCNAIPGVPCAANGGVLLSPPAYAAVATGATQFPVTWRYVACQPSGPVYARLEPTFTGVIILNHAYGITKVEAQDPLTQQWITLTRSPNNFWGAIGITLSNRTIRVTDVNGGVVTGNLAPSNADQPLAAQFPMCVAQ